MGGMHPNHPVSFPGLSAWAEANKTLRDLLAPSGGNAWTTPPTLVISPDGALAITAFAGTEETGRKNVTPSTSSGKGPRTIQAVQSNAGWLFSEMQPILTPIRVGSSRELWVLLMCRDIDLRELRCELSRPISMDEENRIDGWSERIILTPTPFDGFDASLITPSGGGDGNGEQTGEIIVEIRRRG